MGWLAGWLYRKPLVLTGGASGAQTDFQLNIDIAHVAAKMQADFDDIRFTQNDGATLIDAWLESKVDSTSAETWAEFPTTPANTVGQTYYMYYGKADAVSYWDGTATFIFFDDFEDNDYSAKWDDISVGVGVVDESGGKLKVYGNASSGDNTGIVSTKTAVIPPGTQVDVNFDIINNSTANQIRLMTTKTLAITDGIDTNLYSVSMKFQKIIGGSYTDVDSHTFGGSGNKTGMVITSAGVAHFWEDGVHQSTGSGVSTSNMYFGLYCRRSVRTEVSDVIAHKYVANPPTYAFGSEESAWNAMWYYNMLRRRNS